MWLSWYRLFRLQLLVHPSNVYVVQFAHDSQHQSLSQRIHRQVMQRLAHRDPACLSPALNQIPVGFPIRQHVLEDFRLIFKRLWRLSFAPGFRLKLSEASAPLLFPD
jgi:hypothetical protein